MSTSGDSKMSGANRKAQSLCVFCGRDGLSKEHVWPIWTRELIRRNADPVHVRAAFLVDTNASPVLEESRSRQGAVNTLQVRVVCRKHCNGGWMSRLEAAAKPILTPLIIGQPTYLGQAEQAQVAAWITKTAMMLEFADHKRVSSSKAQRRFLM